MRDSVMTRAGGAEHPLPSGPSCVRAGRRPPTDRSARRGSADLLGLAAGGGDGQLALLEHLLQVVDALLLLQAEVLQQDAQRHVALAAELEGLGVELDLLALDLQRV